VRLALLLVVVSSLPLGGGCFDGSLADGALVLCTADADCLAPATCNLSTHLCSDDVTPPQLVALSLVDAPIDLTYADAAGFNDVVVSFTASEPVATASLALANLDAPCSPSSETVACTLTIPVDSTLPSGAHDVVVTVSDGAGNATTGALSIVVDTQAPAIVADSVELAIETGGIATAAATTSSVVTVSFLSDEDLGAAPLAFLDVDGVDIALDVVEVAGRRASFRYDDARVITPGAYALRAELVDRFGHAAHIALVDVTFVEQGELCPRPAGVTCVDFDGDGAFAASSCGAGSDLHDRDATSYPAAFELPGDGRDNDGIAGDGAIDELAGMFFDCDNGDDATADGSRAAPWRTLQAASDALEGFVPIVFLAACSDAYVAANTNQDFSGVVGGLDPTTWQPTGERSIVRGRFNAFGFADSIESDDPFLVFGGIAVRSSLSELQMSNGGRVVSSSVGTAQVLGPAVMVDTTIATLLCSAPLVLHRVHVLEGTTLSGEASIASTSSVLQSASGPAMQVNGALSIDLFHTTLLSLDPSQVAALSAQATGEIRIVASSIVNASSFYALDTERDVLTLVDSNVFSPGPALRVGIDVVDINTCGGDGCVRAERNTALDPQSGVDFRLPSTSPLRSPGVLAIAEGAPTTVVSDFDGDCRFADGSADVGADEVTP
jgi:hypothetical protein